jgi:hypothetical protein
MEAGAAFLLLVLIVLIAAIAVAVWAIASTLRRRKLNPDEDKIDREMLAGDEGSDVVNGDGVDEHRTGEERPVHRRVSGEQRSRSIPRR